MSGPKRRALAHTCDDGGNRGGVTMTVPCADLVWTMRNVHPTSSFLLQGISSTTRRDQVAIVSSTGVLFIDSSGVKVGVVVLKAIVICHF